MWMKIRRRVTSLGCHTLRRTYFQNCIPPVIEEFNAGSHKISLEIDATGSSVCSAMNGTVVQSSIAVCRPHQEEKEEEKKNFLTVNYTYKKNNQIQMKSEDLLNEHILSGRLVDRCIRPLFTEGMNMKIDVCSVIDRNWNNGRDDCHLLAIIASSTALMVSNIPWAGPIGAVKIGRINRNLLVNPTISEQQASDINFLYACTTEKTLMIDLQGSEISEGDLSIIIKFAHHEAIRCIQSQLKISHTYGEKKNYQLFTKISKNLFDSAYSDIFGGFRKVFGEIVGKKFDIASAIKQCSKTWNDFYTKLNGTSPLTNFQFREACNKTKKKSLIDVVMLEGHKSNKRSLEEVRSIVCEVGFLKGLHGSALLSRGETQVLCTACIGIHEHVAAEVRLRVDYDFPTFCINKVNDILSTVKSRREIGHSMLVHKALCPVFPSTFPYLVYINSTVLSSDGSSSMASVCAGSMALMDAGIPLKTHVAGVSIGVFLDEKGQYHIVTDLLGLEDNLGEMDFKIAGTRNGITAIQLDVKSGIPVNIICQALAYGREARVRIIEKMESAIKSPRELGWKYYAPEYRSITKHNKRKIEVETGARLYAGDNKIIILSKDMITLQHTVNKVRHINKETVVGQGYECTIKVLYEKGALVEYHGSRHGLLRIDELSQKVSKVSDVLSIGQQIILKCITKRFHGINEFSLKELEIRV